jgi:hypothetical protein
VEQLGGDVVFSAGRRCAGIELAVTARDRDEVSDRARRERRVRHDHDRRHRDESDRNKVAVHVVAGFGVKRRVDRGSATRAHGEGIAVGRRASGGSCPDHPGSAAAVVDDDLLSKR